MESKIQILVSESLSLAEKKFKEDKIARKFEKSNREFKELISKGFIQERGNNLLSLSDNKSNSGTVFNSK